MAAMLAQVMRFEGLVVPRRKGRVFDAQGGEKLLLQKIAFFCAKGKRSQFGALFFKPLQEQRIRLSLGVADSTDRVPVVKKVDVSEKYWLSAT